MSQRPPSVCPAPSPARRRGWGASLLGNSWLRLGRWQPRRWAGSVDSAPRQRCRRAGSLGKRCGPHPALLGVFASPSPGSPPAGSGCPHESPGMKGEGASNSGMGAFEPVGPPGVEGDSPSAPTLFALTPTPALRGIRSPNPSLEEKGSRTAAGSPSSNGVISYRRPRKPRDGPWARRPGSPGAVG